MKVYAIDLSGVARLVPGPADLRSVDTGDAVIIVGTFDDLAQRARWAAPLGLAAMRGASIDHRVLDREAS